MSAIDVQYWFKMEDQHPKQMVVPAYRSGAVARLTGIPVETLRVWERRYKVVGPRQSATGRRQYAPDDVTRLTVIKRLVDAGYAIGSIAALDLDQLQSMLQQTSRAPLRAQRAPTTPVEDAMQPVRLAIVGEALALRVQRRPTPALQVVATSQNAAQAPDELRGVRVDTLLIELPSVQRETPQNLRNLARQLGAQRIVVEYGYASWQLEQDLRSLGCHLARAPMNMDELGTLCGAQHPNVEPGGIITLRSSHTAPPRHFDNKALAEIASASAALNCECPHHIADLLVRLGNFETYSAECESRSPADAALHQYLAQITGNARAMMEIALERVIEAEGIALTKA
ncbi:MAG: MerR family transcriptional regulator [Betaproteobacteria bacterium]|nr:MerR family transcriptional regulator [Betaproteobacteria bacterium]